MTNTLIVDAGSTKTDWSLLCEDASNVVRVKSSGINPAHDSRQSIESNFKNVRDKLKGSVIKNIFFYGAGCATPLMREEIRENLHKVFKAPYIEVESDLKAAYRALFGDDDGIACILGTGSASACFSNGDIYAQIPSLGYILGDEGSGFALGKALLNSIFKRQLSELLISMFLKEYQIDIATLINEVYRNPKPAAYIASFSPFLLKNIEFKEIHNLVLNEFEQFYFKNILPYGDLKDKKIGMVGSIAFNYEKYIREAAEKYDIQIYKILKEPISSLEKYYLEK